MDFFLEDEAATITFAQLIAEHCPMGMNIHLYGDLGAGKTTLVRGLVQTFLPNSKVKSPTYTLVEDYDLTPSKNNPNKLTQLYHFDLYRLGDPEELEYIGGRDYFSQEAVCLVEWPQRGEGWLAKPDLDITLKYHENGRFINVTAYSTKAEKIVEKIEDL